MVYLDTSVLLPLFLSEPASESVRRVLSSLPQDELIISEWCRTEFASAVGRHVRMAILEKDAAAEVIRKFRNLTKDSLSVLAVESADFVLASRYLERFELGLRAGDALHLAIASNSGGEIYSSDEVMLKCARRFGIKEHRVASSPA